MTSILDGVRNILDPNQHNDEKNFTLSIQAAYERIQNNWNGKPSRSKKNWELRFVPLPEDISKQKQGHSHKAEVPLERAIASAFQGKNTIWNQMPVASGLVESSYKDKRRAVDLVYKPDSSKASYEFLELKVANNKHDSPSDATIEIIEYGLLYLFSRHYAKSLGYSPEKTPVLKASHIGLRVLAEMEYYNHWKAESYIPLDVMNNVLNDFLENHHNEFGELRMDIQLEAFPSNFLCPEIGGNKLNENDMESLCGAIRNKQIHSIKPI